MDRYLIISPHTAATCIDVLMDVWQSGYVTHFEWGCEDGDHTGYVIIEASDKKEALMVVPSLYRTDARAVKLTTYSQEQVVTMHKEATKRRQSAKSST
ncbi:MAG: hypothetical protein IH628_05990 [Proteobacteria bacterium]|nr:hypothetical protein [Pseudomonadota bacterium]